MQCHNKLLAMVKESLLELDAIVARYREDFTGDFFQHLHILTEACKDDFDKREGSSTYYATFHCSRLFHPNMALRGFLARLCFKSSPLVEFE